MMVPWRIVPIMSDFVSVRAGSGNSRAVARSRLDAGVRRTQATGHTILELNGHRLIGAFHQKAR